MATAVNSFSELSKQADLEKDDLRRAALPRAATGNMTQLTRRGVWGGAGYPLGVGTRPPRNSLSRAAEALPTPHGKEKYHWRACSPPSLPLVLHLRKVRI
jgi:hypothetical protein